MGFGFLSNDEIAKSWSTMTIGGSGLGEGLMKDIERRIEESKAPDVKMSQQRVYPGVLQSVLGGGRPYLSLGTLRTPILSPTRCISAPGITASTSK